MYKTANDKSVQARITGRGKCKWSTIHLAVAGKGGVVRK